MSNAIVARRDSLRTLSAFLDGRKTFIAKVIPRHLTPDRVVKVAITAASRTPKLLECTPESFALAVIQASQLGLEAGSPLGEAYLVPYGRECALIVGYRGLIALARRSGEIESIEAHVVHTRDRFELSFGLDAKLSHTPHMPAPPRAADGDAAMKAWAEDADPGLLVAVYAIARLKGGAVQYEVMTRAQVDAIRARSRSSGNGPWVTDYEEMARKTVVRRLAKYLPMSIEMAQAIDLDDRQESGEGLAEIADIEISNAVDAKPATKVSATDAVKATLAAKAGNKPDGDDEPPPDGTNGRGKGSAEEGDDAHGGEVDARPAQGAQASVRLVREWTEEDLVAKAVAWEAYIGLRADPWEVRGAFRKRAAAFNAEGVHAKREEATLARLKDLGESDPRSFLYCTTRRERESTAKAA